MTWNDKIKSECKLRQDIEFKLEKALYMIKRSLFETESTDIISLEDILFPENWLNEQYPEEYIYINVYDYPVTIYKQAVYLRLQEIYSDLSIVTSENIQQVVIKLISEQISMKDDYNDPNRPLYKVYTNKSLKIGIEDTFKLELLLNTMAKSGYKLCSILTFDDGENHLENKLFIFEKISSSYTNK